MRKISRSQGSGATQKITTQGLRTRIISVAGTVSGATAGEQAIVRCSTVGGANNNYWTAVGNSIAASCAIEASIGGATSNGRVLNGVGTFQDPITLGICLPDFWFTSDVLVALAGDNNGAPSGTWSIWYEQEI